METLSRSWALLKQSFTVLWSDKELMWLPMLSGCFCLCATVIIGGGGLLWMLPAEGLAANESQQKLLAEQMAPFMFLVYLATYSIGTFFNVALVSIASNRLAGGRATLMDGLQTAWDRKGSIFQWGLFSASIGMLLQMLERRSSFVGRAIAGISGVVWALASFFVVPLLAAENIGPVEALYKSAQIYRKAWGEQVVGAFSFSTIFFLLSLPGVALPLMLVYRLGQAAMLTGFVVAMVYWILLAVIGSAARGVFLAALYRYATTRKASGGFTMDDLSAGLGRRSLEGIPFSREPWS